MNTEFIFIHHLFSHIIWCPVILMLWWVTEFLVNVPHLMINDNVFLKTHEYPGLIIAYPFSYSYHTLAFVYTSGQVVCFGRVTSDTSNPAPAEDITEDFSIRCLISADGMSCPTFSWFCVPCCLWRRNINLLSFSVTKLLFKFLCVWKVERQRQSKIFPLLAHSPKAWP